MNINTKDYWETRFSTQDWAQKGGNTQSLGHAQRFVEHLGIPRDFSGTICDFGCAEGDAFPVYQTTWPNAKLTGVDFAPRAVERAKGKYGNFSTFLCGDYTKVPNSDVIISAHTFEHLDNDVEVLHALLEKCANLFVIVPYRESPLGLEHLRGYDETSYAQIPPEGWSVCKAGWQLRSINLFYQVYLKNLARPLFGKPIARMPKQIVFRFSGKNQRKAI